MNAVISVNAMIIMITMNGKVLYGRSLPVENLLPQSGVDYQLIAVITEVAQWGTPSCSRP